MKTYSCPACGYDKLDCSPYENFPANPHPILVKPPYYLHWGKPSYDVCSCCGFEYGASDDPGIPGNETSFQEHLKEWFVSGAKWFFDHEDHPQPTNWDIVKQLERAGIEVPDYIKVSRQITGKTK